jgi:hypothetical protein
LIIAGPVLLGALVALLIAKGRKNARLTQAWKSLESPANEVVLVVVSTNGLQYPFFLLRSQSASLDE